jgi:hypothetical protein
MLSVMAGGQSGYLFAQMTSGRIAPPPAAGKLFVIASTRRTRYGCQSKRGRTTIKNSALA